MEQNGWLQRLKQMWQSSGDNKNKTPPLQKILLLFLVGTGILLFSSFLSVEKEPMPPPLTDQNDVSEGVEQPAFSPGKKDDYTIQDFENMFETRLEEMLVEVVGIEDVEVMVNLDSTPEMVIATNVDAQNQTTRETDRQQATRHIEDQSKQEQVVLVRDDSGDRPVIIKTVKPKVRGVLVVAKGADNMQVKAWIVEAVQRVLDVPPHKISILPKKG